MKLPKLGNTLSYDKRRTKKHQFIWKKDGTKKEISIDGDGVDIHDFRVSEAQSVVDKLLSEKKIILVNANSGYGVSKFLTPKINELLIQNNLSLTSSDHLSMSHVNLAADLNNVLLVDELFDATGGITQQLSLLSQILNLRPDIQIVLIMDFDLNQEGKKLKQHFINSGIADFISLNPKLFNIDQATQYALEGPPFKRFVPQRSFFRGLTFSESKQIVREVSKNFPLHFRLIQLTRDMNPYNEDDELMSFENRLDFVKSDVFNEELENFISADPMGIIYDQKNV